MGTTIILVLGLIAIIFITGHGIWRDRKRARDMRSWRLLRAEDCPVNNFYTILTVDTPAGQRKFRGTCTVWNEIKEDRFEEIDSYAIETALCNMEKYAEYKQMIGKKD